MVMKNNLLFFLLLILIFSCSEDSNVNSKNSFVFPWNFNENESIQDILDSVEFVALEAHPEGLFKKADKLIAHDNKFFIFDMLGQNQVFVFDNVGNFLYKIGKRGSGPGEYIGIRNFAIDENFIYFIDNYTSRMFKYNISDGTYVDSKNMPFNAHDMAIAKNGDFVFAQQRIKNAILPDKYAYHIMITDPAFDIKCKLFPFQKEDCEIWSKPYYFKYTDEYIVFHTMMADSIVLLNRNNPCDGGDVTIYKMDFGRKKVPRGIGNDGKLIKTYHFLHSTPEILFKHIAGEYWHGEGFGYKSYIYDKEKQTVYVNNYENKDMSKFLFSPLFHSGDTIFSLYDKNYYLFWQNDNTKTLNLLPTHIRKHLDAGDDVLIKYILK
jgi:hypothetical protein